MTELFDTSSPHSSLSKITGDVLVQLELDPQTSPEEDAGDVTAETQTPDQYYPEVPQTLRHSQERVSARMQHNTEPLPETVLSKFVLVPVPRMSALPESQRASQAARRRGEDCTFFHGVSAVPVEIFDEARFADGLNEDGDGTQGGSGVAAQSVAEAGQILRACTEIVDTDCQALPVELSLLAGEIMNNLVRINWDRRLRLSQIPTCRVAGAISTYVAKSLMNPLEYPGLAEDSRCFWSLACQRIAQLTAGNE